ncbi:Bcr/CflA family drug resistance efflux transporter [Francisella halioticida]|uniref:Bcr/CflA family efflux MFS transporter n=1 Tax=Francisella halioticida TaxID=549298 RepID=UPI001AF1AAC8|nr:Bcr/CflA family efflux MFS transporter [Francisella halioticida]BCD90787.1 Bcr/CflA family drug resistance efflux transporter [Francisella halioticida]
MFQIRKGSKYLVFFVVIFVALPPFAIDTYIPAFGKISDFFQVDVSILSITVSTYLIGFGVGMFFWGALSDRFGRKNILIIGMLIYVLSTILCSFAHDFSTLVFMRFLQGLGDSPAAVAAAAILKDCYRGQKLIKMMATMVMIFMIAPIVAPIIGSIIIYTTGSWQNIFHSLTIYGIILLIITLIIPETLLSHNKSKSLSSSFKVYFKHLTNIPFIATSLVAGLCFGALFSFISSSSNLIIEYYKLGYIQYCILFALNICGILFSSYYIKKKIISSNQRYFIFVGYISAIIIIVANIITSIFFNNIYFFIILNVLATASFSLINLITTTKAIDLLKEGFGAGNAIVRLTRFVAAGFAGFFLSFLSISNLMVDIPIQQLGFIILSILIFVMIKNRLFPEKA